MPSGPEMDGCAGEAAGRLWGGRLRKGEARDEIGVGGKEAMRPDNGEGKKETEKKKKVVFKREVIDING